MARDTTTGGAYEEIVATVIRRSCQQRGYVAERQVNVGKKPGGGNHVVDWELTELSNPDRKALISCKTQNTSGTAEEKLAYEAIKLLHAMEQDSRYTHAWIVMGGTGWSDGMVTFAKENLPRWVPAAVGRLTVITTDELITRGIQF